MNVVMIYFYSKRFRFAPSFNYVDRKTIDGFKEHEILVKYALSRIEKARGGI